MKLRENEGVSLAMNNVVSAVRAYIAKNILFSGTDYPYPDDASFLDEGIVDSMNVLEIVTFVEKEFGIKVNDADIVPDNFDSVGRIAAYVSRKQTARSVQQPA
jgi:acyl carrier protein